MNSIEKLKREWHIEKNKPLTIDDLSKGSSKNVWWRCDKGHEWQARFSNRVNGTDCPYCTGRKVLTGFNDLATINEEIAAEWHPDKNNGLLPSEVLPHSNITVWWQCVFGHEWKAKINNRTGLGNGCPYCAGKIPIIGETDLGTQYPKISEQWHPTKNGALQPKDVLPKSNRSVWWLCEKQHEWHARIDHRVDGRGCPYCSGQKAIVGETDLVTMSPQIAAEWHPTKNGNKKPSDYTLGSHAKVWWKCIYGHEWESTINNRSKCGCPICSGRTILRGFNDLATLYPMIASEWCYEKNGDIEPEDIAPHSNTPYFWICSQNHIWSATPNNRVNGTGCPFCNQHRLIPEKTSLAVILPDIAKEWNYSKNAPKTPEDVTAYCNDSYWWVCEHGHEWKAVISNRAKGDKCPYCSGKLAIQGKNDLCTLYPEIANQWCAERNGSKLPTMYLPMSNEKVWWRCDKGHEWPATIASRTAGSGCPKCKGRHTNDKKLI